MFFLLCSIFRCIFDVFSSSPCSMHEKRIFFIYNSHIPLFFFSFRGRIYYHQRFFVHQHQPTIISVDNSELIHSLYHHHHHQHQKFCLAMFIYYMIQTCVDLCNKINDILMKLKTENEGAGGNPTKNS